MGERQILEVPAVFMRGGTSRGVFFCQSDLPDDPQMRDRLLLRVLGSPDKYRRQIDGMGGASSSTSKAAIIGPSSRPDCDVDYLIAQIDIEQPVVDYSSNCGNLASSVGPFAIRKGLVSPVEGLTIVRIWQVNTRRRIVAYVPTSGGEPVEEGDYSIDGVTYPGAPVRLDFEKPDASSTPALLPTGSPIDELDVPGFGRLSVSMVDAAQITVFVRATDIGLDGTELKARIDGDKQILELLEAIRRQAAHRLGLVSNEEGQVTISDATPKIAFVGPAKSYLASNGRKVSVGDIDIVARIMSMAALHHAYEVTGAIATAAAAMIPDTIVSAAAGWSVLPEREVRIGHVSGIISIQGHVRINNGVWSMPLATLGRTSRRLMDGQVFVPSSALVSG